MKLFSKIAFFSAVVMFGCHNLNAAEITPVMVIHGGTSGMDLNNENFQKRAVVMKEALKAGQKVLNNGGSAEEAVIAAIVVMEDNPIFNAGKGAVFNSKGENELDASIMDGKTKAAGAVAGAKHIKNPVKAAKIVKDTTSYSYIW